MRCCGLLLGSKKITLVDVDAINEADQFSCLHFPSFYHSHKCVDLLLKKRENPSLLHWYSMMPLEEDLLGPSLDLDWDMSTKVYEIVKIIGEKDLKFFKQIGIKCNCKYTLALKLAKEKILLSGKK